MKQGWYFIDGPYRLEGSGKVDNILYIGANYLIVLFEE